MNGFSTESGAQEHVNDDAPDEFDLAMDSFASGQTPPADQAAGTEAADPNDTGSESGTPPGSGEEAGVSDQTAGAAPPVGDQSTSDIWANAPAEYREAYEAFKRDSDYRLSATKGRLSAADRELARLRSEQNRQPGIQQQQDGGKSSNENDPFNPEKLAQLREEYGDVAGPLVDAVEALKGDVDQLRRPVAEMEQGQHMARYQEQVDTLAIKHPDWETAFRHGGFAGWYEQQPQFIRQAIERNANEIVDGQEAALVLDLFKQSIGAGQQPPLRQEQNDTNARLSDRRARQLDAGRDAASRGGQSAAAGVPDDFDTAMEAYAAQADAGRKR
jgi:hypothetical protein